MILLAALSHPPVSQPPSPLWVYPAHHHLTRAGVWWKRSSPFSLRVSSWPSFKQGHLGLEMRRSASGCLDPGAGGNTVITCRGADHACVSESRLSAHHVPLSVYWLTDTVLHFFEQFQSWHRPCRLFPPLLKFGEEWEEGPWWRVTDFSPRALAIIKLKCIVTWNPKGNEWIQMPSAWNSKTWFIISSALRSSGPLA